MREVVSVRLAVSSRVVVSKEMGLRSGLAGPERPAGPAALVSELASALARRGRWPGAGHSWAAFLLAGPVRPIRPS